MTIKYAKQTLLVEQLNEIEHFFLLFDNFINFNR